MQRSWVTLLAVFFVLIATFWAFGGDEVTEYLPYATQRFTGQSAHVLVGGKTFGTEVVRSEKSQAKGLSGRRSLPADRGMLFVFAKPGLYPFVMRDMRFALDIIWIQDGKIVDLWRNAPYGKEPPAQYTPKTAADQVLEIRAGMAGVLQVGDMVVITDDRWFFR
ncbi:MAG: DUF192 domain-containing protein [Patescibacteria group bacterium]|jgi:hypothetical protein